jgi:hypothetical protein
MHGKGVIRPSRAQLAPRRKAAGPGAVQLLQQINEFSNRLLRQRVSRSLTNQSHRCKEYPVKTVRKRSCRGFNKRFDQAFGDSEFNPGSRNSSPLNTDRRRDRLVRRVLKAIVVFGPVLDHAHQPYRHLFSKWHVFFPRIKSSQPKMFCRDRLSLRFAPGLSLPTAGRARARESLNGKN